MKPGKTQEELTLTVEKLVYGGDGLAHADGSTVFVPYTLPGETVKATVRSKKKKLIWADFKEVVSASPERVAPPCPHFGVCGGCHYQQIAQTEQIKLKKEILRETLSRLGGISWGGEITEHTAEPYGYRNRAQWAVRNAKPRALGYFLPESSNIIPIDSCQVLSPALAKAFATLQELARAGEFGGTVEEIEAFVDSTDTQLALNVAYERFEQSAAKLSAVFREALPNLESLLLLDKKRDKFELTGPGFLKHKAGGYEFHVSHLSFFQVNRFLIEELLQAVIGGAKGESALDLYAGVGFFTLPLAKQFGRVVSVDANLSATRDLRTNAENAGIPVVSHNAQTEEFLANTEDRPDFVVLDPPRFGLGENAARKLADLGALEIVYLSCDPSTLARDLAVLTQSPKFAAGGDLPKYKYEISGVDFFDLFPQTFHIETLVRLRRVP